MINNQFDDDACDDLSSESGGGFGGPGGTPLPASEGICAVLAQSSW